MICIPCGRGFHKECYAQNCKSCHPKKKPVVIEGTSKPVKEYKKRGKTAEGLKDAASTGRKRAAELYPIDKEKPCEWQGLKNCGGGRYPIIGCVTNTQTDRHHGPVKDTTRNSVGNVHRICTRCHNHWHELNDPIYDQREFGLLPHDPESATPEELVQDELAWMSGLMKTKFTLASSINKKGLKVVD